MEMKGAVLIIGSLLWEDHLYFKTGTDFIRRDWRNNNLKMDDIRKNIELPIRYGKKSDSRFNTYTMVFCNSVKQGSKGILISLIKSITSFEEINAQAIEMAKAEGIYKANKNERITSDWGSIGLLLNPTPKNEKVAEYNDIRDKWVGLYQKYSKTFFPCNYAINNTDPVLDKHGFLQLEWKSEFAEFDFVFASPTTPEPCCKVLPYCIAKAIHESKDHKKILPQFKEKGYSEYFEKNKSNGITTYQDDDIEMEMEKMINK